MTPIKTPIGGRDYVITETDNQRAVIIARVSISMPVADTCPDWRRDTEEISGQSFYWCECPLDVSLGGSEDY